jgi:hypothetical protein
MTVWIFHGTGASFASGVFETRDDGMAWIAENRLTGLLVEYPVGQGSPNTSVLEHVHVREGAEDDHYEDR